MSEGALPDIAFHLATQSECATRTWVEDSFSLDTWVDIYWCPPIVMREILTTDFAYFNANIFIGARTSMRAISPRPEGDGSDQKAKEEGLGQASERSNQ